MVFLRVLDSFNRAQSLSLSKRCKKSNAIAKYYVLQSITGCPKIMENLFLMQYWENLDKRDNVILAFLTVTEFDFSVL